MAVFRYRAKSPQGNNFKGLVRADDPEQARNFLNREGRSAIKIQPYRGTLPWFTIVIFSLMSGILLLALGMAGWIGVRNYLNYRLLSREGIVTRGVMESPTLDYQGKQRDYYRYPYHYKDLQGRVHRGWIKESGALFSRTDYFSRKELGGIPGPGETLGVTFLKTDPRIHVPFPLTPKSIARPLIQGGLMVLILALALVFLFWGLLQTLKTARESAGSQDPGEPGESFVYTEFQSQYYPVDPPQKVRVMIDGIPQEKTLVGRLERVGWRSHLQLLACLAAYYLPSLLLLDLLPADRLTWEGRLIPGWQLALGLSVFVLPVTVILLAWKKKPWVVILGAGASALLHLWSLKALSAAGSQQAGYAKVVFNNLGMAILAWGLSLACLMAAERWQKLKDWLDLEKPVYLEDQEED